MTVKAMDHFTVLAADLAETQAFYEELLGLREGYRPPFDFPGAWLYAGKHAVLHIIAGRDLPKEPAGVLDHMAFSAAGLTDTVARASAGALAHLPVAKVTNLARAMEDLKEAGYWLVGLDEEGEKSYTEVDYTSPTGIIMGGEGNGLHELTRKRCDFVVSLPTTGPVKSLNVSVATGIVLFEALRQRRFGRK